MHADEVHTDATLVRRLLALQFPEWADLPIEPVPSGGTDNAIYRLGRDMAVRLPRIHWAPGQVHKEQQWLPRLGPLLPLRIPAPLAMGEPGEGYPWHWSIYDWLEGESSSLDHIADPGHMAIALAEFIATLRRIDTSGGPPPGEHNFYRGVPLALRDDRTRSALKELRGIVDVGAATAEWEAALAAPPWQQPPVWIHGDLQAGNLLTVDGRLCAVIDFGGLGVGDPACDLIVAWNLLPAETRGVFRGALLVDDASWARGRGWALSIALTGLPYYLDTNPDFVEHALHTIDEVLSSRGGE